MESLDDILQKFKPLVRARARGFFLLGGDMDDLLQEGMIGLYKAIMTFDEQRDVAFPTFASLCVVRQIQTAIKLSLRQKHQALNTAIPLDIVKTLSPFDPEAIFLQQETKDALYESIETRLTPLEKDVLLLYLADLSHAQIAEKINKNKKSVDNALSRIKKKLAEVL